MASCQCSDACPQMACLQRPQLRNIPRTPDAQMSVQHDEKHCVSCIHKLCYTVIESTLCHREPLLPTPLCNLTASALIGKALQDPTCCNFVQRRSTSFNIVQSFVAHVLPDQNTKTCHNDMCCTAPRLVNNSNFILFGQGRRECLTVAGSGADACMHGLCRA